MARTLVALPDFDIEGDVTTNPEVLMMLAEGDSDEADVSESQWLAGTYVTKSKQSSHEGI